jgi:hypothetical protein
MSPELETLDQLLGGDMPLAVIRTVYPDLNRFTGGMMGLLKDGQVRLFEGGVEVSSWRWREALSGSLADFRVQITDKGITQIR